VSGAAPAAVPLPLFPLNTVLFPGGPLALRIFEPRYLDMVSRCMRESGPFGVVLIREGQEAGPVGEIAPIGTSARIVDFTSLPDGLLGLSCLGERRFRVLSRWTQRDGLHMGEVEYLPGETPQAVPEEHRALEQALRRVLAEVPDLYAGVTPRYEDASWVSYRLAEIVPLPLPERLELLIMTDPVERLTRIAAALPRR
jgi:uncharacterized protein